MWRYHWKKKEQPTATERTVLSLSIYGDDLDLDLPTAKAREEMLSDLKVRGDFGSVKQLSSSYVRRLLRTSSE